VRCVAPAFAESQPQSLLQDKCGKRKEGQKSSNCWHCLRILTLILLLPGAGEIRRHYHTQLADALIVATALSRDLPLSTRNLNVDSRSKAYSATLRQFIFQTLRWGFALALSLERQENETSLLGKPFALSPGAQNSRPVVTAFRLTLE
jgi:hypothetical protein